MQSKHYTSKYLYIVIAIITTAIIIILFPVVTLEYNILYVK